MTDFESAFKEGLAAAQKADAARAEINEVLDRVSATLTKSTEGKLAVGKRQFLCPPGSPGHPCRVDPSYST